MVPVSHFGSVNIVGGSTPRKEGKQAWIPVTHRVPARCKVEPGSEHDVGKHEHASSVVIASRFNVCVREEEDGQDDGNDVPARENKAGSGSESS